MDSETKKMTNKQKHAGKNNEDIFNNLYDQYSKEVERWSGGLVKSDKSEFLKLYCFYSSIIQKDMYKLFEASTGVKIN